MMLNKKIRMQKLFCILIRRLDPSKLTDRKKLIFGIHEVTVHFTIISTDDHSINRIEFSKGISYLFIHNTYYIKDITVEPGYSSYTNCNLHN